MPADRERLSRERVAAAALRFIDEHGEAALSMRKLGAELGVEAMSLYNHVENKQDLLSAVSNLLYAEVLERFEPDPSWTWQQDLCELARVYRATAHAHRRAHALMTGHHQSSIDKYLFLERCYRVLTKAGFATKDAALAFDTVAAWAVGAIGQELGTMEALTDGRDVAGDDRNDDREWVPSELQQVVDFSDACKAWTADQRFDDGLRTLLAGLEARLAER